MALGVDRENFNKLVNYARGHVGGVMTVHKPKRGELVRNFYGEFVKPIQATKNPDELFVLVHHYMASYNQYPDEPILEYNNEKTQVNIKKPYENKSS